MAMIPNGGGNETDYGRCGKLRSHDAVVSCANSILEHCAKLCEELVERDAEYGGRFGGYGNFMGEKTGSECAKEIRDLIQTEVKK